LATMLLSLRFIPGLLGAEVADLVKKVAAQAPGFVAGYLRSLPAK
jgi:hypothetical protein